ncbi:MAG: bifunctional metallophosphatase/5'-nucleotidase [Lachnospiraceae bacterium]|nr:bifunctional metallophosphatase/5'-nucleotidase [Lachnospiraceae bacterium]
MRKNLRKSMIVLAIVTIFSVLGIAAAASETAKSLDVLFVHDTHSHLNEFATVEDGESQIMGGFAKLKTLINEKKAENPDTLILDAGDFSMGTLIQVVFEEEASEIRMLGNLGVEVTTLGNHEFDYKAKGLANMMNNAVASGDVLPEMVVCNVDWEAMEEAGFSEDQQMLYDAFENYGMKEYVVLEKGDVKIAVTGVFGQDCLDCVPNCPLEFENPVEAVKETVAEIQEKEDVDMLICVSHSGTWKDEDKSEDEILAKSVPELDLIISGHTHTKLDETIQHGDTYIVSAAEYGKYLGSLSMTQKEDGRWAMDHYELITVGEDIEKDAETQEKVDALMDMVDSKYLEQFGYTKDQVLCTNEIDFAPQSDTSEKHTELNLGSIIADAYTYAAEQVLGADTVAMSVAPSGTIRDSYAKGEITTENVFNSFSLGIGRDEIPGYPLIGIYLTGEELKMAAEIDASISDLMTTARLYTDGLYWHYNPNRMILNKTTEVFLVNNQEERVELEDDKLYLVVTDFYTSQMLGGVTDLSMGLLSIVPKFADGTPIENYEDAILMKGDQELKAWVAIADYMSSFEDTDGDGIGNVPAKYGTLEGRKVVEDSKNIIELVKNPNKFFFMILGIVLLLLAIVAAVIFVIVKIVKKVRKRKNRRA